jgi:MoxR-like ATPase
LSEAKFTTAPDGVHVVNIGGTDVARVYTVNGVPTLEPLASNGYRLRGANVSAYDAYAPKNITSGHVAAWIDDNDPTQVVIRPPKRGMPALTLPRRVTGGTYVPGAEVMSKPVSGNAEMMNALASAIRLRQPFVCEGPPGVGKTHGAQWLGGLCGYNVITMPITPSIEADDLIGAMAPYETASGNMAFKFQKSAVIAAIELSQNHPTILILDELNRIREQGAIAAMYGLMANGVMDVTAQPRPDGSPTKYIAGDLYIVATQNPSQENLDPSLPSGNYETNDLDTALKSRLVSTWLVDFPGVDEECHIIRANVPNVDMNVAHEVCVIAADIRKAADCNMHPLSNRLLVAYCQSVMAGVPKWLAYKSHISNAVPAFIRDAVVNRGITAGII